MQKLQHIGLDIATLQRNVANIRTGIDQTSALLAQLAKDVHAFKTELQEEADAHDPL